MESTRSQILEERKEEKRRKDIDCYVDGSDGDDYDDNGDNENDDKKDEKDEINDNDNKAVEGSDGLMTTTTMTMITMTMLMTITPLKNIFQLKVKLFISTYYRIGNLVSREAKTFSLSENAKGWQVKANKMK